MTADQVARAINAVGNSAPERQPFAVRLAMGEGREAQILLPWDTTDSELVQIVGVLTGPARVELIGQQAKASSKILTPDRGILRPV